MRREFYAALVVVSALLMGSCRTDKPPIISIICLGDGFGGGDCTIPVGGAFPDGCAIKDPTRPAQVYCPPSALKNMWMTTQTDEANFSSWCYKVPVPVASSELARIRGKILSVRQLEPWETMEVPHVEQSTE